MPSKIKVIIFSTLCLVIMSQYTNCDNYEDFDSGLHFSSGLCFDEGTCAEASAENLQVSIDRDSPIQVSKLNSSVVITGKCFAANYDRHTIDYSYKSSSSPSPVRNSQLGGCVNGKFHIGLSLNGANANAGEFIDLEVSINGIDQFGRTVSSTRPKPTVTFRR